MARKIEIEYVGDASSLSRANGQATKSMGKLSGGLSKLGRAALIAGAALGTAMVVGTVKAVEAASDLNESMNKSNVVFGKQAKAVARWSKTTANAFGISQSAALEAAAGFGGMFKAAGQAGEEAANMSELFVKAAADLGSFFNVDPTQALEDLRSGLAGESEPLRKFNIFMNEATIKTYAYKHGIAEAGSELTENQKILARQGFILDHIGKASNDFAETSESLANVQRRLRAQVTDLAAALGSKLLPTLADAGDRFSDFMNRLSKAKGFEAKLRVTWVGLSGAIKDLYNAIQDALFGSREVLHMNSQTVVWETPGLIKNLRDVLESADWTTIGQTIGQGISERVRITAEFMNNVLTTISAWVNSHLDELADIGAKMMLAVVATLTDPGFWAKNWKLILAVFVGVFPVGRVFKLGGLAAKGFMLGFGKFLSPAAKAVVEGFIKLLDRIVKFIDGPVQRFLGNIPGWVTKAFRLTAVAAFIGIVQKVIEKIKDLIDWIKNLGGMGDKIRALLGPFGDILGIIGTIIGKVQDLIGLLDRLRGLEGAIQGGGGSGGTPVGPGSRPGSSNPSRTSSTSSSPGRAVILSDSQTVSWLRELDGQHRRATGRGILT